MMDKRDALDNALYEYGQLPIRMPEHLMDRTLEKMALEDHRRTHTLPILMASIIFINMLTSIFAGSIFYLLGPLTRVDWLIVGVVFSSMNGLFYGLTYAFKDQIRHTLEMYL